MCRDNGFKFITRGISSECTPRAYIDERDARQKHVLSYYSVRLFRIIMVFEHAHVEYSLYGCLRRRPGARVEPNSLKYERKHFARLLYVITIYLLFIYLYMYIIIHSGNSLIRNLDCVSSRRRRRRRQDLQRHCNNNNNNNTISYIDLKISRNPSPHEGNMHRNRHPVHVTFSLRNSCGPVNYD